MLAMTEKSNPFIQVVVTRACDKKCSGCTQLLPLRGLTIEGRASDPVHMSVEVFDEALFLTDDWPRQFSIFGGNAAVHPQFQELMKILCRRVPNQKQRVLFCNNPMEHGDLIRDVFLPKGNVFFNVHGDTEAAEKIRKAGMERCIVGKSETTPSYHTPILMDWHDFPNEVKDYEAWKALRESCQFNHEWSGAIMERNGQAVTFFCEIAGALDAMLGTNHGIPIERGWWRRKMDYFQHQVSGCCDKGCGVPLKRLGSRDSDEAIDYSKSWSPIVDLTIQKRRAKVANLHETMPVGTESVTDYLGLHSEKPR